MIQKILLGSVVIGAALLLQNCEKDDEGKGGSRTIGAPAAQNVIPASFRNTVDEAGFKRKLPETTAVLQDSTSGLSLKNPSATPARGRKLNMSRAMILGLAKQLDLSQAARDGLAHPRTAKFMGFTADDGLGQDDLDVGIGMIESVREIRVGEDCTPLLGELTGQYDSALASYTKSVNEIGQIDFSQTKGLSKDTPDSKVEAFAYKMSLTQDDFKSGDVSSEGGAFSLTGRFGGGANDRAVALRANGAFSFTGENVQSGSAQIAADLNTYADVSAQLISIGAGLGIDANTADDTGQPLRALATLTFTSTLKGGLQPAQTLNLKGEATNGSETIVGEVRVAMERRSSQLMTLDFYLQNQDKVIKRNVSMTIESGSFGYETCTVAAVN